MTNFTYFMSTDLSKHLGKWIAIIDEKVVAEGDNAKAVYDAAKHKFPDKVPFLTCVPTGAAMIL